MKRTKSKTIDQDLFDTLMRFHREIALPDMTRVIEGRTKLHFDRVETLFAGVFVRLDRCIAEVHSINEILARIAP